MRFISQLLQYALSTLFSLALLALFATGLLYLYYAPQLPDKASLRQIELQVPLRVYSREKRLVAEYGEMRRRTLSYNEIPKRLIDAFIAIEDARFYEHNGIDFKGVMRAVYNVLSTGNASQGASTITMQLARNAFFDNQKTLDRKLRETLLALKIEENLTKEEILELYLNKIYLGNRAYGIGAAAEIYYGKKVNELNLAQIAMIAGLPKAPSAYNPIVNPERAIVRRNYILQRMYEQQYIQKAERDAAIAEPVTATVHRTEIETEAPYLAEMVRSAIVEKFGKKAAYNNGYHVYTTLDSNLQQYTTAALRKTLLDYDRRHGYRGAEATVNIHDFKDKEDVIGELATYSPIADLYPAMVLTSNAKSASVQLLHEENPITLGLKDVEWARAFMSSDRRGAKPNKVNKVLKAGDIIRLQKDDQGKWRFTQIPKVAGAAVLMDPADGAVLAVMGGFDYKYSKFNRVTQMMRQPGSSFKPFLYSAALAKGYSSTSVVNDVPISIPNGRGGIWKPQNYGKGYIGPTTLGEALAKSRNLVSVRLMRSIGINYTIDYATRFGFERKNLPRNLTLSLGTGLTNPLQMASAYSSFANGGFRVEPYFITRIEDEHGKVLFTANAPKACGDNIIFCPTTAPTENEDKDKDSTKDADKDKNKAAKKDSPVDKPNQATTKDTPEAITAPIEDRPSANRLAAPRIMDSRTNQQIVSMLQGVAKFGTAAKASRTLKRSDIGGKTGTTNDQKDAWFCGITPKYVAVTWAGFDDMKELGNKETATNVALPMWIDLMSPILANVPEKEWLVKPDLKAAKTDTPSAESETGNANNLATNTRQRQKTTEPTSAFEYKSVPTVAPVRNHYYNQAEPPRRSTAPRSEAVEIPEQIF